MTSKFQFKKIFQNKQHHMKALQCLMIAHLPLSGCFVFPRVRDSRTIGLKSYLRTKQSLLSVKQLGCRNLNLLPVSAKSIPFFDAEVNSKNSVNFR